MAYQKQNFANGNVLTAENLNHMENGIADAESTANETKSVVDNIIDPTLTLAGKAADAKATGNMVGELKEDIGKLFDFANQYTKNINLTANSTHSSNKDKMAVTIKNGEKIRFSYSISNSQSLEIVQVKAFNANGDNVTLFTFGPDEREHTYTATDDYFFIGIYTTAPASDCVLTIFAYKDSNYDQIKKYSYNSIVYSFYINQGGELQGKINSDGTVLIRWCQASKLVTQKNGVNYLAKTFDDLYNSLASKNKKTIDGINYINILGDEILVYDVDLNNYKIETYSRIKKENQIPLIGARYNHVADGELMSRFNDMILENGLLTKIESIDKGYYFTSSTYNNITNENYAITSYAQSLVGLENTEQFLFFTDPHVFQHVVDESAMEKAIGTIEHVYNNTPTSFVLCGGDWLQNNDTATEAAIKLGRIDGIMRGKFGDRYYPILGNHDTNYQGATEEDKLSNSTLTNLWFREYGKMYYSFTAPSGTRFYVFDTGIDWDSGALTDYRLEQCIWYADKLLSEDVNHSVIALHVLTTTAKETFIQYPSGTPFTSKITLIAQAYNNKTSIDVNGKVYDFSGTTGKVAFLIAGHSHFDFNFIYHDIPVVMTVNSGYTPSFDLCLVDYDNAKLKMKRVGDGNDREIDIVV